MNRKDKIISAAVILGGFGLGLFTSVSANASPLPAFVASDNGGAFVTKTAVVNGEVVAYKGAAHTVVSAATNVYSGVTTFRLTNPLAASGLVVLVPVS